MIHFETLVLPRSPNTWLLAPRDLCEQAQPHATPPVFVALTTELRDVAVAAVLAEPRTTQVEQNDQAEQFAFVARTALMGFRDDIDLRILPVGAGRATLALYSRSRLGYSDMGVNAARGRRILARVSAALPRSG
jgi:uncharacterized protein (DUF1499 family)